MATYIESDGGLTLGGNGGNGGWGNSGFFGGDGIWAILLFAMIFGNGGWGFGGGFGGNGGAGNMLYDINANTNRGFDQAALVGGLNGIQASISNGFANAEVSRCNAQTNTLQAINGVAMSLQNCCCENRAGLADLKYTVATENCADRQALSEGVRDIIASNTANTQAILDKLCQQEIDAKNDLISTLRAQLSMADLRASQTEQTARILAGQGAEVDALYNRLSNCPVPSTPVYGRTPIFTCANGGCGCNVGVGIQ